MALREYLSATLSTSSTATIVTKNIESKAQCNVNLIIFLKIIQGGNDTLRNWLECPNYRTKINTPFANYSSKYNIIYTYNSVE